MRHNSKETAVCLKCRRSARVTFFGRHDRRCPDCGANMIPLGTHWRIPKRTDDKGWKLLRRLVEIALSHGYSGGYYLNGSWRYNLTRRCLSSAVLKLLS